MATFYDYVVAPVVFAVWMLGYAVIDTVFGFIIPIAQDLGSGTTTAAIGWMQAVRGNYPIIGVLGIFVTMLGIGVLRSRRSVAR